MSVWRTMPPVLSPLSLRAVLAAADGGSAASTALGAELTAMRPGQTVVLTDSGTSALALAIAAAATTGGGRPVALPAYACYDLVSAALAARVPVTFYDVDATTLAPDAASVADAIASGVSSLVVVHQYGIRVELDDLLAQCRAAGIPLIEDAAQAWGGTWRGTALGMHGQFGVLSFGRGKGLTGGGGGALLVDAAWAAGLPSLAATGAQRARAAVLLTAQWILARPSLYRIPLLLPGLQLGETHFRPPSPPQAMAASSAAAIAAGLPCQAAELRARRAHASAYAAELTDVPGIAIPQHRGEFSESAWLRFPVLVAEARTRIARGLRLEGVAAGYPIALPHLPEAQAIIRGSRPTPGAERLASQALTLPTHSFVTPRDRARIVARLRSR